jgi:hypothetical protein
MNHHFSNIKDSQYPIPSISYHTALQAIMMNIFNQNDFQIKIYEYASAIMTISLYTRNLFKKNTCIKNKSSDSINSRIQIFNEMRNQKELVDFTIEVKEKQYEVHGLILASQSPVFRAMLRTPLLELKTKKITLIDESHIVEWFIDFIYTNKVNIINPILEDLLKLMGIGHRFEVTNLVAACSKELAKAINNKNIFEIFSHATLINNKYLMQACFNFCKDSEYNLFEIYATAEEMKLELLVDFIKKDETCLKFLETSELWYKKLHRLEIS